MKPLAIAAIVVASPFIAVGMTWGAFYIVRAAAVVLLIAEAMLGWA